VGGEVHPLTADDLTVRNPVHACGGVE
jgi:hypothetical protein